MLAVWLRYAFSIPTDLISVFPNAEYFSGHSTNSAFPILLVLCSTAAGISHQLRLQDNSHHLGCVVVLGTRMEFYGNYTMDPLSGFSSLYRSFCCENKLKQEQLYNKWGEDNVLISRTFIIFRSLAIIMVLKHIYIYHRTLKLK